MRCFHYDAFMAYSDGGTTRRTLEVLTQKQQKHQGFSVNASVTEITFPGGLDSLLKSRLFKVPSLIASCQSAYPRKREQHFPKKTYRWPKDT